MREAVLKGGVYRVFGVEDGKLADAKGDEACADDLVGGVGEGESGCVEAQGEGVGIGVD